LDSDSSSAISVISSGSAAPPVISASSLPSFASGVS
jgi:hypothetical protein